jgi:guanylate cyclase soluble subunit beta
MVLDELGEEDWLMIERETGAGPAEQISLSMYDDSLTLAILAATAKRMDCTMAECLEQYGRFWIRFAERGSYGSILNFTGTDLVGFIANLDRMHQAVVAVMPDAKVPSFGVIEEQPGQLRVTYRSERSGLEPFVTGLLHGLLERFELEGTVAPVNGTANHAEFLVTYSVAQG